MVGYRCRVLAAALFAWSVASLGQTTGNALGTVTDSSYDPNQSQSNFEYGKVTSRLEPRSVRGAVKISF